MIEPTRESPWEAVDKLEALSEQPKSQCKCPDCNLPELESLGYESGTDVDAKSLRATEENLTPVIESKTKVENSEVVGQPLEQPKCHQTMTSRECIGCQIDAVGECPLTDKDKNTLDKPEQPNTKSKEWLCGGTKIIKATKEEREYYAELDIVCPGCPDCEPERRKGHNKLVYDKESRTIVTIDPHPEQPTTSAWEAVDKLEAIPEQPNTELLIVKTIQGLTTCINNELEKLVVLTANMPMNECKLLIIQALANINSFEKTTLYELQKAFE